MTFRSRAMEWEETVHEAGVKKSPTQLSLRRRPSPETRAFLIVIVPPGTIKPSIRHPQQETSKCPISFMS